MRDNLTRAFLTSGQFLMSPTKVRWVLCFALLLLNSCKNKVLTGSQQAQDGGVSTNVAAQNPSASRGPTASSQPQALIPNNSLDPAPATGEPKEFSYFGYPDTKVIKNSLSAWATYYYLPQVSAVDDDQEELLDGTNSDILGKEGISRKDWCASALQGSAKIKLKDGSSIVVNFKDRSSSKPVDCTGFIGRADVVQQVRKNRFMKVNSIYGKGSCMNELIPFRTIATDKNYIPCGSLVFIPDAVGKSVTWPDGRTLIHDGYFIAGDAGAAITGNHIDIFVGTVFKKPFDFVKSTAKGTFTLLIVQNESVLGKLRELSRPN